MAGAPKTSAYSDRYVAFLDILGFSNIVRRSVASPEQATKLIEILEDIANAKEGFGQNSEISQDDFKAQSFCDCIVLSENASPTGLFHLLMIVSLLGLRLLANGIFTRGGIAKGKLHHSDKVVFGPAMLEAYRLESTISRFPRVLIDEGTHRDYQSPTFPQHRKAFHSLPKPKLSDDGPPFVDFLNLLHGSPDGWADGIEKCRSAIQSALDASVYEPGHYEKLRWLSIYWNGVAAQRGAKRVKFPQIADWDSENAT